jgi:hypothetical protein
MSEFSTLDVSVLLCCTLAPLIPKQPGLKLKNLAKTTFRLSPLNHRAPYCMCFIVTCFCTKQKMIQFSSEKFGPSPS